MTRIKLCGVTALDNALLCAAEGADMLGLNFYPPSPRSVEPEAARAITDGLRAALGDACPLLVGVFVNETADHMRRVMEIAGLDAAQLSGDEPPDVLAALGGRAYKAIRPRSAEEAITLAEAFLVAAPEDERLPALLVDAYHKELYGGTGEQASIEVALAVKALAPRLMLAGGLTPENVADRVRSIQPWAVDTASGVEDGMPGIKDHDRVQEFIVATRGTVNDLSIDKLQLHIAQLCQGPSPVDAWGTLAGKRWDFYSRFDEWWFSLSLEDGLDPMNWDHQDQPRNKFYVVGQHYGEKGKFAAGYMPVHEALRLIKMCASKYLRSGFQTVAPTILQRIDVDITLDTMQPSDWPQIARIYQEGIDTGRATLETAVPTWEAWHSAHLADCRLVARDGDQVLGWAALTPVSGRCVYAGVAEASVYIAAAARRRGVGTALLNALIAESEKAGFWTVQAGILRENAASIALCTRCGFREIGFRERIGQLNGVWRDVVLMERRSPVVGC